MDLPLGLAFECLATREVEIALEIAEAAKIARDYVYVFQHLVLGEEEFQSDLIQPWIDSSILKDVGIRSVTAKKSRYRQQQILFVPEDALANVNERIERAEASINQLVEDLYS